MIYDLSLQTGGFIAGMALVVLSLPGLIKPGLVQIWLKRFPRSSVGGIVLLSLVLVWSFWLLATMEMGEFSSFRRPLMIVLPIGYVLVLRLATSFSLSLRSRRCGKRIRMRRSKFLATNTSRRWLRTAFMPNASARLNRGCSRDSLPKMQTFRLNS